MKKKSSITLEKKNGKIVAARVPVTSEMMRLVKKGREICGATEEQVLLWAIQDGLDYMRSSIEDGTLASNGHEPHLIEV